MSEPITDSDFPRRLLKLLDSLNRKERFWLVKQAVGSFALSKSYRDALGESVGLTIPADSFVAMDYHLDWIAGAIALANDHRQIPDGVRIPRQAAEITGGGVNLMVGNQEDIDLLVAFADSQVVHMVLVEAKFDSGWSNSVMIHKTQRLSDIFGDAGLMHPGVQPHFLLTSPTKPPKWAPGAWPAWMKRDGAFDWIPLQVAANRLKMQRTDEQGRASKLGEWITFRRVTVPSDEVVD